MGNFENKIEEHLRRDLPLYEYMGLTIESATNGVFRCGVPLNPSTSNHFHTIHAALQWAAVEVLGGLVWIASKPGEGNYYPVVKRFEIDFKGPAPGPITAETRFSTSDGEAMRDGLAADGRYDFELDSCILNASGETIVEAKGFYAIRAAR
jgi:acyl-coenzyme A thioesterase PaaI-like protein